MSLQGSIDTEQDRADQDAVVACMDALSERRLWILYAALHARGHRISEAPHTIARLAPRKATA